MSLTPIFKRDENFNAKAAQAAYDLVMKMDDDSARAFTEVVVADVLEQIIEDNLDVVQAHLDRVVAKRIQRVKKALHSTVSKGEHVEQAAALLEIEKAANPYDYGYRFKESDFNRDPGTGRFRTKVSHTQKKPIPEKTATALGIATPKNWGSMSNERKARYQDEYRQLAAFLGSVYESAQDPSDTKVALHFEDRAGRRFVQTIDGTRAVTGVLEEGDDRLIGIEAKPGALTVGGAAFGLTHALGRGGVEGVNSAAAGFKPFADDWTREAQNAGNRNEQTFNRIAAGSKYLGDVAPYSTKAQMASAFGSFVGNMGPEAERVIGPTARKTAYRYRGTEKTPDKKLVHAYASAISHAKNTTANDPFRSTPEGRRANLKAPSTLAPVQMASARAEAADRAPTWTERELGRRTIVAYFKGDKEKGTKGKLPDANLYGLQLASGNTPPSEGVLLNKDGQLVSQAVGYGDDHYLPFNLKNLKALKGGEYIRTRSVGGLTSEDIYTGLISGARQVTVVSRSGVFTMEFAEDFKGGRRHNDKARRMTRRYEQILDAVQSEKVDRGKVDPRITEIIEEQVHSELDGIASPRVVRQTIRQRVEEYKSDPELTAEDEELVRRISREKLRDGSTRDEKEYARQVTGKLLAQKQTRYRLDGHGYEAALKALEEQFPYYVTVRAFPEDAQDIQNLELDRGYVEPGRNRPTAAAAGLFGAKNSVPLSYKGTGKFSAADADYQGARTPRRGAPPEGAASGEGAPAAAGATPPAGAQAQRSIQPAQMPAYIPAVSEMQSKLKGTFVGERAWDAKQKSLLDTPADQIAADPIKQKEFDDLVTLVSDTLGEGIKDKPGLHDVVLRYRKSTGSFSRKPFEAHMAGFATNMPFGFPGAAYEGNDLGAKAAELRKIEDVMPTSVASPKPLSAMTDNELVAEVSRLTSIKSALMTAGVEAKGSELISARVAAIRPYVSQDSPALRKLMAQPDDAGLFKTIDTFQEQVHRARAVLYGIPDTQREQIRVVHAQPTTPEQREGFANSVGLLADKLEQIAETIELDEVHDTDLTTELRSSAAGVRERLARGALDQGQAKAILDAHGELLHRGFEHVNNRPRSGNILG